jgi:hypothetical protein
MTEIQLSDEAIQALKLLAKGPGSLPDHPETGILWTRRYVMGSPARTHITQAGKAFITKHMAD